MSDYAERMWHLLPAVRKRHAPHQSRLYGLLKAIGTVLDTLYQAILTARLRRYALVACPDDPYYASSARGNDLNRHALDRGLRRITGESDAALLERIATLPYRNRFLGTKEGMRYLIEELHGLRCDQIVEYYADDQTCIILSEDEAHAEVETNLSHVFCRNDQEAFCAYRGTRIYSASDLTTTFHFWMSISNPQGINYDPAVVQSAVNAVKPAHTKAKVYFHG